MCMAQCGLRVLDTDMIVGSTLIKSLLLRLRENWSMLGGDEAQYINIGFWIPGGVDT